jgi:hypothetical protein
LDEKPAKLTQQKGGWGLLDDLRLIYDYIVASKND